MLTHLITTQQNNGEGSRMDKISNKNDLLNTTKPKSILLKRNLSFVLETSLDNLHGTLKSHYM